LTRGRLLVVMGLFAIVCGCLQGLSYGRRLSDPRGSHLAIAGSGPRSDTLARPGGRIVLVVIDGLRADAASSMRSTAWLQAHGTCRPMDVGSLTRSRPVYALLSSGVEPDRSGVRSNDAHTPAPVESLWQVARRSGMRVSGASGLAWWRELFPDGFDEYRVEGSDTNLFLAMKADSGLQLIHPGYVDDAGHQAGAGSALYQQAVARADGELLPFLQSLDANRDTVLVTADHGHTRRGGHGSDTSELRRVLACAAGHGIAHGPSAGAPPLDARALPALLAVLAGLPLPRHLDIEPRALANALETLDPAAFAPDHLSSYQREIEQRQATVTRQLSAWVRGGPAHWTTLMAQQRRAQHARFAIFLGIGLLALSLLVLRRHHSLLATGATALWVALTLLASYGLTKLTRGSFDIAAVNTVSSFVPAQALTSALLLLAAGGLHVLLWRDLSRLRFDSMILVAAALLLSLAHLLGFGWPVGFPLPHPALLFLPYPLAVFIIVAGAALLVMGVLLEITNNDP
jgi:hypothetical protein